MIKIVHFDSTQLTIYRRSF